jgi:hypothetical protein
MPGTSPALSPTPMKAIPTRILIPALAGLLCAACGWWLRGAAGAGGEAADAPTTPPPRSAALRADEDGSLHAAGRQRPAGDVSGKEAPGGGKGAHPGLERMFTTDPADMLAMMEAIGALTRMSDGEAKEAWTVLSQRTPSMGFGNSLSVLYLWARMTRMGEDVEIPAGWGAEQYQQAIETEKARRDLAKLEKRLESGEQLVEAEKRALLSDVMRKDPLKGVELWCLSTKPGDYRSDAKWMGDILTDPATRAGIMARIRAWQAGGDVAGVVSNLARNWIARDPAAVERWLQEPEQADVRDLLMNEVVNARSLADPAQAWEWSRDLPEEERLQALGISAMQLAVRDPENGMKLIAGLQDPGEREAAIKNFANILAARDFEQWQEWRDSLPAAEQDVANESAFALWVNMDVDKATEWLNTRSTGETRDRLIAAMVNYHAPKDAETCAEWIRTISDDSRRREAAGAALSSVGPYDLEQIRIILNATGN